MNRVRVLLLGISLASGDNTARAQSTEPLSLKVTPQKTTYCRGDSEVVFLRVQSQAQFTNLTSTETVSLTRGDLHVDYIRVAREIVDFAAKNYELNVSITSVLESSAKLGHLSPELFLTLKPGQSAAAGISFSVPVSAVTGARIPGTLQPGTYFAVVGVSGWLDSEERALEVQANLKGVGTLWTTPIRSLPMVLEVSAPSKVESCR